MFYAKSTGGFYSTEIHSDKIPEDAVEITEEEYAELLDGQSSGKIISAGNSGKPFLSDPPGPTQSDLALTQIRDLESKITNRRLREAVLGIDEGWLAETNERILKLRLELK